MKAAKIKRILVPTDFSKTGQLAIEHAGLLARVFKADLYILHSIEVMETIYSIENPSIILNDLEEVEKTASEELNKIASKLKKQHAIPVKTICTRGKCYLEILQAVKDQNIDIVVMGTHGTGGFDEYFIGSNAHKTVTMCPCPVMTIQTISKKTGFSNIVLPIDNSLHSRQKVDLTIAIANRYGSKIHILGLLGKGDDTDQKKFRIKLDSVEKAVKKAGLPYLIKISKGDNLAVTAMNYSKKVKADLIVVLADHESEMKGTFLGALSKQIINHSKIPVLSIKPIEGNFEPLSLAGATPF